jgi:hypothetical protein
MLLRMRAAQAAADLLKVSRRCLLKLVNNSVLPWRMVGPIIAFQRTQSCV